MYFSGGGPHLSKAEDAQITVKQATAEVQLLARRMALMYHHIGEVLTERLGKERAQALMKEAIWRYGTECGEQVRLGVQEMGLPLTARNFSRVPDLPALGWDRELIVEDDGEPRPKVNYCPLADVWLKKGSEEMGRIYCFVDQSKFEGYNPALKCLHLKNVLDGDPYCVLAIREQPSIKARVYRFDPAVNTEGRFQEYTVVTDGQLSAMALMARIHEIDPTFACRTSMCFHGTCGSCWVRVNGKNVKGCLTIFRPGDSVTIEPHSGYRVVRDVVVDFESPVGPPEAEQEVEE